MFYEVRNVGGAEYFRVDTENNMNFPRHLHQSFEIILVTGGKLTVDVDSGTYTLEEGDALMIFPHQIHSLSSEVSRHAASFHSYCSIGGAKRRMCEIIIKKKSITYKTTQID